MSSGMPTASRVTFWFSLSKRREKRCCPFQSAQKTRALRVLKSRPRKYRQAGHMGLGDRGDAGLSECFLYDFSVPDSAGLLLLHTSPLLASILGLCVPCWLPPSPQYPHPSLSRLSQQHGLLSAQNYLRSESGHTDSSASLIRTVSHRWQRPRSSLGDSTPLPSIYSAHHVAVQTLYQQQLESVFRSWGLFFPPSRNKSALSRLEILAFCDWRGINPHGSSPYRSDTHCQLPLTIPALSYLCFCPMEVFCFFFRVRLCT